MRVRLRGCGCAPIAYAGGSSSMAHSPLCEVSPEAALTSAELHEWHAARQAWESGHPSRLPAKATGKVLMFPIAKTKWHTCTAMCGCERSLRGDGIPTARHR